MKPKERIEITAILIFALILGGLMFMSACTSQTQDPGLSSILPSTPPAVGVVTITPGSRPVLVDGPNCGPKGDAPKGGSLKSGDTWYVDVNQGFGVQFGLGLDAFLYHGHSYIVGSTIIYRGQRYTLVDIESSGHICIQNS